MVGDLEGAASDPWVADRVELSGPRGARPRTRSHLPPGLEAPWCFGHAERGGQHQVWLEDLGLDAMRWRLDDFGRRGERARPTAHRPDSGRIFPADVEHFLGHDHIAANRHDVVSLKGKAQRAFRWPTPYLGRELRAMTLEEAAASVPQPLSTVRAIHPGGQGTECGCRRGRSVGCGDTPGRGPLQERPGDVGDIGGRVDASNRQGGDSQLEELVEQLR
jgi:hypothetical protein